MLKCKLLAELADMEIEPVKYLVSVQTSKKLGAGTNADVYMTIFGERGESGPHELNGDNYLDDLTMFERGNDDKFTIETLNLGELQRIVIGHDNDGPGSGWHLKRVKIVDPSSDTVYYFPCRRWLDAGEDDGITLRMLPCVEHEGASSSDYSD